MTVSTRRTFTTRRGRPKLERPQTDYGTPELILKRATSLTSLPLDQCLERSLITPPQHRAGLHLRRLYIERHGLPHVSARDLTRLSGSGASGTEQSCRSSYFLQAVALLEQAHCYEAIMDLCVYDFPPLFLIKAQTGTAFMPQDWQQREQALKIIRSGLESLRKMLRLA